MKTLRYIFAALALTMGLAACQKEGATSVDETPTQKQEKLVPVTICASMGQQTKTALDATDKSKINWSEGDKINITIGDETCAFTLIRGAGETAGTFNAEVSETFHDALFNSATTATASYPTTGTDVKATQTYADGSFATDTFPMTGDVACGENPSISFTSSAAIVKIAGITAEESSSAILSYGSGESDKISMTFDSAISGKDLYFVVPTGKTDFNLTIGSETRYFASLAVATEACHGYTLEKAVAKIGTTGYTTLPNAFNAVNDNETIELLEGCSLSSTVTISKTVTLDLKNKSLTLNIENWAFNVNNGVKFALKNGTVCDGANGKVWGVVHSLDNSGPSRTGLTVENVKFGTFNTDLGAIIRLGGYVDAYVDNVSVTTNNAFFKGVNASHAAVIKNCTITDTYGFRTPSIYIDGYKSIDIENVTITGTETTQTDDAGQSLIEFYEDYEYADSPAFLKNCILTNNGPGNVIYSGSNADVITSTAISESTFTTENRVCSIATASEYTVNVYGGTYKTKNGPAIKVMSSGGFFNIYDEYQSATTPVVIEGKYALFADTKNAGEEIDHKGAINLFGDNISTKGMWGTQHSARIFVDGGYHDVTVGDSNEDNLILSGGTYTMDPRTNICFKIASGYKVVANEGTPSTWSVVKDE